MGWPFGAGIVRLAVLVLAGWFWEGSLAGLFWIVAASYALFGGINVFAMASGHAWGREPGAARVLQPAR
jgi:hypothetical protein